MNLCGLVQRAWHWSCRRGQRTFQQALRDPMAAQDALFRRYLATNAGTEFGRQYGFKSIRSIETFQQRVPLSKFDDYSPWIDRIRRGERQVLTSDPVIRLVPSSGSTAACKLIPYTATLLREFQSAIAPWVAGLFDTWPASRDGPAYWSISPAFEYDDDQTSAIPIGFDDDSAYLNPIARRLVTFTLAVPPHVRRIGDIEAFRYITLFYLLSRPELRLVSIWHPTFLSLLLDALPTWWERLLNDLEHGDVHPPGVFNIVDAHDLHRTIAAQPERAAYLRSCSPLDVAKIWPRLAVISCWADGASSGPAAALARRVPHAAIQAKGLVATEAMISIPFAGSQPLAVASHFFEFIDEQGNPRTFDSVREGESYSIAVTTGGGLYRYQLGDRVHITGRMGRTPTLRFVGKEDRYSDLAGEKLSEGFVAAVFEELFRGLERQPVFAMLAPDERQGGSRGYTLYWQHSGATSANLAARCDELLSANPHYRHCVRLGQLNPVRRFDISSDAHAAFVAYQHQRGKVLGQIKPAALSAEPGWSQRFVGRYVTQDQTTFTK